METFLPYVLNEAIINKDKEKYEKTLRNLEPFRYVLFYMI